MLVTCPQCHRRLSVPDKFAGKICKCPGCAQQVPIPAAPVEAEQPAVAAESLPPQLPAPVADTVALIPRADLVSPQAVATVPPIKPGEEQHSSEGASPWPEIAGYEILSELGRGGMGVVYQARHKELGRTVALKMILSGMHAGEEDRKRFLAEAEAVSCLQHPNIVQLYDFGRHQDLPYFTLEFVPGGSLHEKLRSGPLPPKQAAHLVEQLARGMAHAHQHGIVHRDLKPHNVLLSPALTVEETSHPDAPRWRGKTVGVKGLGTPKITDFGLVKRIQTGAGLTITGAIVGTLEYMAPEQAAGETKRVGPAADVYALGAILYACLTGRPPFQGPTPIDTLRRVVSQEPVPPRRLQRKVPHDLETICLKCLRKDPRRRYESADSLADDLQRLRIGEPIEARTVGRAERVAKWVRRNPLGSALILAIVLGIIGISWAYSVAVHGWQMAAENEHKMLLELKKSRTAGYATQLLVAQLKLEQENFEEAEQILQSTDPELRHWEYGYLRRQISRHILTHRGPALMNDQVTPVSHVAISSNGKRLVSVAGSEVKVWDAVTGEGLFVLKLDKNSLPKVAISGDGQRIFTADTVQRFGRRMEAKVWDGQTGKELFSLRGELTNGVTNEVTNEVTSVAISADGKRLVSTEQIVDYKKNDGFLELKVWDGETGKELFSRKRPIVNKTWRDPTFRKVVARISDDGKRLVSMRSGFDSWKVVVPVEGARTVSLMGSPLGQGPFLAASALFHGRTTPGFSAEVTVWDAETGKEPITFPCGDNLTTHVAISSDGRRLVSVADSEIKVWDSETWKQLASLQVQGSVRNVGISGDGKRIVWGVGDVWKVTDTETGKELFAFKANRVVGGIIAINGDGKHIAFHGGGNVVQVWHEEMGKEPSRLLLSFKKKPHSMAISSDGRRIISVGALPQEQGKQMSEVKVWDGQTGKELFTLLRQTGMVSDVWISGDGQRIVTVGTGQDEKQRTEAKVWDGENGRQMYTFKVAADEGIAAISGDGRRIVSVVQKLNTGRVKLIVRNGENGTKLFNTEWNTQRCGEVAISDDGQRIVLSVQEGPQSKHWLEVKVLDGETGKTLFTLPPKTGMVTISGDGQYIVTVGNTGQNENQRTGAKVWDGATGKELFPLQGHIGRWPKLAFSRDGKRIISASKAWITVWDAETGQALLAFKHTLDEGVFADTITSLVVSADGLRLFGLNSLVGTVRVWEAAPWK